MRLYECTVILRPELSKTKVEEVQKFIDGILAEKDGVTKNHEYWGLRQLAYPIQKLTRAHYIFFYIQAPVESVAEMERKLRIREDVLRHLVIKVEAISDEPSPMAKVKPSDSSDKPKKSA